MNFDRESLNELLHDEVLIVTFTKKDGSERIMHCTLREDLLPAVVVKEGEEKKVRKVNEDVMPVYDTNAKAFRSFRIDSIKNVKISVTDKMKGNANG